MASDPSRPTSRLLQRAAKATALVLIGAAGLRATFADDDAGSTKWAVAGQAGIVVAAVGMLALLGPRLFSSQDAVGLVASPSSRDAASAPTDLIGRVSPTTSEAETAIRNHASADVASAVVTAPSLPRNEILEVAPPEPLAQPTTSVPVSAEHPTTTGTSTLLRPAQDLVTTPSARPAPATTAAPPTTAPPTTSGPTTQPTTTATPATTPAPSTTAHPATVLTTTTTASPPTTTIATTTTTTAPPATTVPTSTTAQPTTTARPTTTTTSTTTTTTAPPTTTTTAAPTTTTTARPTTTRPPPTTTTTARPTTTRPPTTTTTARPVTTTPALSYWDAAGQQALAQISYPWQARLPGWTIVFKPERSGYRGLTLVREKRIEVYVRQSPGAVSTTHVLAHELGHAVDVTRLNAAERAQWLDGRGLPRTTRWFPNSGAEDFASGAGDFAEAFANWQSGTPTNSRLAGQPTSAQLTLVAQLSN